MQLELGRGTDDLVEPLVRYCEEVLAQWYSQESGLLVQVDGRLSTSPSKWKLRCWEGIRWLEVVEKVFGRQVLSLFAHCVH